MITDFTTKPIGEANRKEISLPFYPLEEANYNAIIEIIDKQTGVNLTGYRRGVAMRRISRRMRAVGCEKIEEYMKILSKDKEEVLKLLRLITIQVSQFFRNPGVYKAIDAIILPALFQKSEEESLIWSAGCAEGEEPYSLAILLLERHSQKLKHHPVRIIATDVNEESIRIAKEGRYIRKRVTLVDDSLLRRYFRCRDNVYELKDIVRVIVEFRCSDILQEKGIEQADVVMLRNLLIYFDKEKQDKILKKIDKTLKSRGFLVLGKSETIPLWMRVSYQAVAFRERIYRKL